MDNNQSLYKIPDKEQNIKYSPMVTIITPVLNGVNYLEACIESVLRQSYPHIEHVFVDGGSTDGVVEVLSRYGANYSERIRFISERDRGTFDAANKGIKMAKGVILGFIGSDDTYEPGAIHTVVDFFMANPNAYLAYGGCNIIDENSEIIGRYRIRDFNLKEAINGPPPVGGGPATFYRQEVFEKIGLFNDLACDFDFLIRAGKLFQIYRIEKVLANFRYHKGSASSGSWESRKKGIRDMCIVSRRHGGSVFSWWCMLYYAFVISDWLRPVFGSIYPFIGRVIGKNIWKSKEVWETSSKL